MLATRQATPVREVESASPRFRLVSYRGEDAGSASTCESRAERGRDGGVANAFARLLSLPDHGRRSIDRARRSSTPVDRANGPRLPAQVDRTGAPHTFPAQPCEFCAVERDA